MGICSLPLGRALLLLGRPPLLGRALSLGTVIVVGRALLLGRPPLLGRALPLGRVTVIGEGAVVGEGRHRRGTMVEEGERWIKTEQ